MRFIYWALSLLSLVAVWYTPSLHVWLAAHIPLYHVTDANLIQVIAAVAAGVFATKASDASRELRRLLKVAKIEEMMRQAEKLEGKTAEQRELLSKERQRLGNLVAIVKSETERQFARDMIQSHIRQLTYHWERILTLQAVLDDADRDTTVDPTVLSSIQRYIIRSRYLQLMGRGFLGRIPIIGGVLEYLFGPLWDYYYLKNIHRLQRLGGGGNRKDQSPK